jgi:multiple sugar transport system permease protein
VSAQAGAASYARLATPYVVGLVLVVAVPLLAGAWLGLTEFHGVDTPRFTGLDNVRTALDDQALLAALRTTGVLVALVVPTRLLLVLPLALLLAGPRPGHRSRLGGRLGRGWARVVVVAPTVVPESAWALLWLWLLNPVNGPVALALGPGTGLLTEPGPTRLGVAAMVALQLGESFVVLLAARAALPRSALEAAALEGASGWCVLRRVTLPLLAPVVGFLVLRDTVLVATAVFVPILVLTAGGPRESTTTLPVLLYVQGFRYGDLGYVSAVSVLVLLAVVAVGLLTVLPAWLLARRRARW